MFNEIEIAKVFGPLLIIMGIWGFLYQKNTKKVVEAFNKNLAANYLGGFINLIIGLTLINSRSHWHFHLTVLVTILGWVIFLKGLLVLFFPNFLTKRVFKGKNIFILSGLISIIWGSALVWLAFIKP